MNTKMVSYAFDTMPELTEADVVHLKDLATRPDSEIDTSDAPVLTDEQWKNAKRRRSHQSPTTPIADSPATKEEVARPA